jgi:hypothetical protein
MSNHWMMNTSFAHSNTPVLGRSRSGQSVNGIDHSVLRGSDNRAIRDGNHATIPAAVGLET